MNPEMGDLRKGNTVYDTEGKKVGEIEEVHGDHFTIRKGFIFKKDLFIPTAAVGRMAGTDLHLNVRQGDIDALGWDTAPTSGRPAVTWRTIQTVPYDAAVTPLLDRVFSKETLRIPVRGERVTVEKTPVITGEVALTKEQETTRTTVETSVRRTEVDVVEQVDEGRDLLRRVEYGEETAPRPDRA